MADEFVTGLGILTGAGLVWMTLSGWYTTPHFDGLQLIAPPPESVGLLGEVGLALREVAFWLAILGALTFWVVIPAIREGRAAFGDGSSG